MPQSQMRVGEKTPNVLCLRSGGMVDSSRYLGINGMICCMFWMFSPSEEYLISKMAGSTVTLHCKNNTFDTLRHLTWTMNGKRLFSFSPKKENTTTESEDAIRLNIKMSDFKSFCSLVIEKAQKYHTGNYTCETTTNSGVWQQDTELVITDEEAEYDYRLIAVAAAVPCVCLIIFIVVFVILRRARRQPEHRIQSPPAEMQQQPRRQQQRTEEIYENCLEIQRHALAHAHKRSAH
ncbi:uncharacterized protein ACNS7B_023989 isoform 2-T2 [Menidia menidia]